MLKNGSLYVKEVHMQDAAVYGCTIGNSGGFNREEATLFVRGMVSTEKPVKIKLQRNWKIFCLLFIAICTVLLCNIGFSITSMLLCLQKDNKH